MNPQRKDTEKNTKENDGLYIIILTFQNSYCIVY